MISFVPCVSLSLIILCFLVDVFHSLHSHNNESWRKGRLNIFHKPPSSLISSWLHALLNKCLFECMPSDMHVYNALICDEKLTLEPWIHVPHLYLLQVKRALPGVFSPREGVAAVGLPQAGAAPCGVNS